MLNKLKKIKPGLLTAHVVITLGYPAVRAILAERNRLQVFTDAMTIVAMILLIGGILYAMVLRGSFDLSNYFLQRGFRSFRYRGIDLNQKQTVQEFLENAREKRADAFNYPLFLGILYLIASIVIAYGILD